MTLPSPPGVFDIIPNDEQEAWHNSAIWQHVEKIIRQTAQDYGYQEIRTPIFERTELFKRSVGETSDIVSKEMYTFIDKGERSLSLRPEGTAPVIRSFIEHQMHTIAPVHKLYYIAPMFRYERSQAGRYRQHHQFGAEAIGNGSPEQDVELIDLLYTLYHRLGLTNLELCLNSIGNAACRQAYREALKKYLRNSFDQLSPESKARFEANPLRILDSKDEQDKSILVNAPSILDFLDAECQDHFQEVQKLLKLLKIPFKVSPQLVRGLDYYNKTVFEITAGELGAQNSIGGGGRYDGLMKALGGPDLPTMGFGTGLERIIQTLLKQNIKIEDNNKPTIFLIALGEEAKNVGFTILHELRNEGINAYMDFGQRKLNKLMQQANDMQAKYVVVIGENEIKNQEVELKEMSTGKTQKAPLHRLGHILNLEKQFDYFLLTWKELSKPFQDQYEASFFLNKLNSSIDSTKELATSLQTITEKIKELL